MAFKREFFDFQYGFQKIQQFYSTIGSIMNTISFFYSFATSWCFGYIVSEWAKGTTSNFKWNIEW